MLATTLLALLPALPLGRRLAQENPAPAPVWVERRLSAMGTWLDLRVRGPERSAALAASERAVRALEACEARLSTWVDSSELARLNCAPVGEVRELSLELAADLARVRSLWLETEGAFDPGLGALVSAWGLRTGGRRPSGEELTAALATGGFASFEVEGRSARRRHPLAAVEEGGFGKGIGLDAALAALVEAGVVEAELDLGGQWAVLGGPSTVVLADPRERERAVLELTLGPGSLSTSGNSERGIVVDGVARGHLLDPRTGAPAADFGSLSVWAPDATAADCLSTGLYVLGPERALRWCAARPGIELVLLLPEDDGRIRAVASAGWRGRLRVLVPDLELRYVGADSLLSSVPVPATVPR